MAHGMELLGDRWALFVVRELMLGPRRFGDLRADLPGISANVLTQRLTELEANGILVRRKLPPPASVQVYELTDWGYEAEPIVQELGRWAARSLAHDPTLPISGVSILLSFRTMIDRSLIGDLRLTVGFRFGEDQYVARIDESGIVVERGRAALADIAFTGQPTALAAFVWQGAARRAWRRADPRWRSGAGNTLRQPVQAAAEIPAAAAIGFTRASRQPSLR